VRGSRKTAAAAALALLLTAGGCGGSSDSSSSAATARSPRQPAPRQRQQGKRQSGREGEKAQPQRAGKQRQPRQGQAGGAAEFRVPGGDNSVQEFGAEASYAELEEAGAALHGFLDARVVGEWSKACAYLSKPTIEGFEQLAARSKRKNHSCEAIMGALTEGVPKSALDEAAQAEVGALRVEGDRAFLLYHGARNTDYTIPMAKEGGAWKVGALAGTPLS
jgi:hypothetical protein